MKRAFILSVVILTVSATMAIAQTFSYDAEVSTSSGPHSSLFPSRSRALVTYTLDPTVADSNADPQRGIYTGAVLSMSVNFPDLGIFANAGAAGLAQTFNDVGACKISDQVFFFGGPITSASTLAGDVIQSVEVDFLSKFVVTPDTPFMLSSDALPVMRLPLIDSFVRIQTPSGNTFVHFVPHPQDSARILINEIGVLQGIGILTPAQAGRLTSELNAAIDGLDRGNTRQGCDNFRDFINRTNELIDDGVLSPVRGQQLIDDARTVRSQMGC